MTAFLVVGARGQVGRALMARTGEGLRDLVGLDLPELDITDADQVTAALAAGPYRAVINAAAYTAVDKAESDEATAHAANCVGPRVLAEATARIGIPLLHISTDYVFDGASPRAYREDDPTGPAGAYGRTKRDGEEAVRAANPHHVILRTAWVYAAGPGNFVATMLRLAAERPELRVVADQHGGPTPADAIADALLTIATQVTADVAKDAWGTYHFTGAPATTWHAFAEAIVASGAKRLPHVPTVTAIGTPDYPTPARRPANSVLDCAKIAKTFGIIQPDWRQSLDRIVDTIQTQVLANSGTKFR